MPLFLHSGTWVNGIRSSFSMALQLCKKDQQSRGSPKDIIVLVYTTGFSLFVSNAQICRANIKLVILEKKLGPMDHTGQIIFFLNPKFHPVIIEILEIHHYILNFMASNLSTYWK